MEEAVKDQFKGAHARMDRMEEVMERIRDRPPLWATWVMTAGGATIGALITWLISCMKP